MPSERLGFVPFDKYARPAGETTSRARRLHITLAETFFNIRTRTAADRFDNLVPLTASDAERLVPRPSFWTLENDLDGHFSDWLGDADASATRLVVYPPASRERFLTGWAEANGLSLEAFSDTTDRAGAVARTIARLRKGGIVVIPDLHNAFLRARGELAPVRELLAAISNCPSKVVVGCNSWAWQFLRKAVHVDHYLPEASVPEALDASHMQDWFRAATVRTDAIFASLVDGGDIFTRDSRFFKQLAAESLGTPWVAWALWQDALLRRADDDPKDGLDEIYVRNPRSPALPVNDRERSLLILHALLIHGGLRTEELDRVLPFTAPPSEIAPLRRAGILRAANGTVDIEPIAYASVVNALRDANLPGDGL